MDDRLWNRAKQWAQDHDQSVTAFIRIAVRKHCDTLDARQNDAGKRGDGRSG